MDPLERQALHDLASYEFAKARLEQHTVEARPGGEGGKVAHVYSGECVRLPPKREHGPGPDDHTPVEAARQMHSEKRERQVGCRVHMTLHQWAPLRHELGIV